MQGCQIQNTTETGSTLSSAGGAPPAEHTDPQQLELPGMVYEDAPAPRAASLMRASQLFCVVIKVMPQIALSMLIPTLAWAVNGSSTNLNGSLTQTNNNLLDFLQNDLATICMIIGGAMAIITHVFNGGMGTKFFLQVFGGGVIAMAFTTVLSLARGLANSVGH